MLVMLAPTFDGSPDAYARLARVTGMVAYDLRSRVKPGSWGVVRALGDELQARELGDRLIAEGLPAFVVPRDVGHDPNRRIVPIRSLDLTDDGLVLHLRERTMPIPFGALSCIVRGEVHLGRVPGRSITPSSSSSTFRAVVPSSSELQVFRESMASSNFEAFAAADLHFVTVQWIARIDARNFDFAALGADRESTVADLDRLVDLLATRANVRVDRGVRSSSVVSVAFQGGAPRNAPPASSRETLTDERFDPYSRVIGEAERQLAARH